MQTHVWKLRVRPGLETLSFQHDNVVQKNLGSRVVLLPGKHEVARSVRGNIHGDFPPVASQGFLKQKDR